MRVTAFRWRSKEGFPRPDQGSLGYSSLPRESARYVVMAPSLADPDRSSWRTLSQAAPVVSDEGACSDRRRSAWRFVEQRADHVPRAPCHLSSDRQRWTSSIASPSGLHTGPGRRAHGEGASGLPVLGVLGERHRRHVGRARNAAPTTSSHAIPASSPPTTSVR